MSDLEEELAAQLRYAGLPEPEREFRFAPPRRWRFDFVFRAVMIGPGMNIGDLAIEVEGGTRSGGRHVTGQGFEDDLRKYAEGALLGWTLLRVSGEMVRNGEALRLIQRALLGREPG